MAAGNIPQTFKKGIVSAPALGAVIIRTSFVILNR